MELKTVEILYFETKSRYLFPNALMVFSACTPVWLIYVLFQDYCEFTWVRLISRCALHFRKYDINQFGISAVT